MHHCKNEAGAKRDSCFFVPLDEVLRLCAHSTYYNSVWYHRYTQTWEWISDIELPLFPEINVKSFTPEIGGKAIIRKMCPLSFFCFNFSSPLFFCILLSAFFPSYRSYFSASEQESVHMLLLQCTYHHSRVVCRWWSHTKKEWLMTERNNGQESISHEAAHKHETSPEEKKSLNTLTKRLSAHNTNKRSRQFGKITGIPYTFHYVYFPWKLIIWGQAQPYPDNKRTLRIRR